MSNIKELSCNLGGKDKLGFSRCADLAAVREGDQWAEGSCHHCWIWARGADYCTTALRATHTLRCTWCQRWTRPGPLLTYLASSFCIAPARESEVLLRTASSNLAVCTLKEPSTVWYGHPAICLINQGSRLNVQPTCESVLSFFLSFCSPWAISTLATRRLLQEIFWYKRYI